MVCSLVLVNKNISRFENIQLKFLKTIQHAPHSTDNVLEWLELGCISFGSRLRLKFLSKKILCGTSLIHLTLWSFWCSQSLIVCLQMLHYTQQLAPVMLPSQIMKHLQAKILSTKLLLKQLVLRTY